MAKKKTARSKAPKRGQARSIRKRARSPRQPPLPGTEAVRSAKLDRICEGIGDERDTINKARQEESGMIQGALQEMQRKGITVYRHARIELSRVPGAEKLRVRVTKEEGDADASDLEAAPAEELDEAADIERGESVL
jgi:hypothetical protein